MVDLGSFQRNTSIPERGFAAQVAWMFLGSPLLRSSWLPGSGWRVALLRSFGARIADNVQIKPGVRVKYPWKLRVGRNSWIGEDCWIDNMALVTLGANVCLSQAAYLCTGNHDWKSRSFRMFARPITLEDGCWVASRCTLGPGTTVGRNAIAAIGSVGWSNIPPGEIHGGNPCARRGVRTFEDENRTELGPQPCTPSDPQASSQAA